MSTGTLAYALWHMRTMCTDKWVTANLHLWKYPWIAKSHWVLRQDCLCLLVAAHALKNTGLSEYRVLLSNSTFLQVSCTSMYMYILSYCSFASQYKIEEMCFNISNKLSYPRSDLLSGTGYVSRMHHQETAASWEDCWTVWIDLGADLEAAVILRNREDNST